MREQLISALMALALCITAAHAQVGVVRTLEGDVRVFSGQPECAPRFGLDINEGDAVRTGSKSWAVLAMMDGTRITVRPDTEVRIDAYRHTDGGEVAQNQARFTLSRGAVRVIAGRIAGGRNAGFLVVTPDATLDMRGTDQDVAFVGPTFTALETEIGTYAKVNAGGAVLHNASGEVKLAVGQAAIAESAKRVAPRLLPSDPYFFHWHNYIDRRAAAVIDKLDAETQ
jgi:hypothetical protein